LEPSGTGTDYAAIQANDNVTTSYTWTLPAADASGCIQSNGSGTLSITACGGGGANTALSNLAAVAINTSLISDTDNTDALGSATIGWSDLFLGSGGLINWANGDAVITHSSGLLTVSTGDLRVTTAGTNAASVVTVGGTQTLTNKTLTAPRFADLGFIADANGNELIILDTVGSAVNEWTLANGSTGVNPKLTASGETNVGLDFQVKGTGVYRFLGTASGPTDMRWFEDTDNGTNYVSVIGPASTSDAVLTLQGVTGTIYSSNGTDVVVADGGTGVSTLASNGVLYGNGTGAVQVTAQGAANTVLVANAGAPSFSAAITVGTSVTSPTINATSALQLNGTDINTAGTLTNVAYENQVNTFTANNIFQPTVTTGQLLQELGLPQAFKLLPIL
jgi:hypothetical protein